MTWGTQQSQLSVLRPNCFDGFQFEEDALTSGR